MYYKGPTDGVLLSPEVLNMDADTLEYLVNNFALPLGIDELRTETLHHFMDGLLAFQSYFRAVGYDELVKELDNYIDDIEPLLPKITGKSIFDNPLLQYIPTGDEDGSFDNIPLDYD